MIAWVASGKGSSLKVSVCLSDFYFSLKTNIEKPLPSEADPAAVSHWDTR